MLSPITPNYRDYNNYKLLLVGRFPRTSAQQAIFRDLLPCSERSHSVLIKEDVIAVQQLAILAAILQLCMA